MQPVKLELLAPAKTSDIGIAAIDCGADAVYIAGPAFGARAAAGNPTKDIASLTAYAHKFSARIYATVNTIVYEDELEQSQKMIWDLYDAGVDALIVQDLGITRMELPPIELHASTQCAIRTPQQAAALASLGFRRLILERQLSLDEIRAIRAAVPDTELEFFVHGAICVCYSGNCYLSQYLAGRSANRGACIQACRSLYDVVDGDGRVLVSDRAILSPKDYRLDGRLEELADAGICSFKIEGRLKNDSYVKNLCRHYRGRIDEICARRPEYVKASSGTLEGGFSPNPEATFNRGYTQFFIDGERHRWNSLESTKSLGEYIGNVVRVSPRTVTILPGSGFEKASLRARENYNTGALPQTPPLRAGYSEGLPARAALSPAGDCYPTSGASCRQSEIAKYSLSNGDGLVFVTGNGIIGMRADVVRGREVEVKDTAGIAPGDYVYRNYNIKFEKELQANMPRRKIDVEVVFGAGNAVAVDADGFRAELPLPEDAPLAEKQDAAAENIRRNMGKRTDHFDFKCDRVEQSPVRFYPASALNALRRELAAELIYVRTEAVKSQPFAFCAEKVRVGNRRDEPTGPERSFFVASEGLGEDETRKKATSAAGNCLPGGTASYSANCANHLAREVLMDLGYEKVEDAYEIKPVADAELMRSRYCIKYELGLCPKLRPSQKAKEPLYLVNAGRKLKLSFDCKSCEMIVSL
ncbi:MAG: U32 family peptidase [Bacteroidales bacterium]|nr:U32 family peptidase [Bacteroidales bacterium]